MFFKASGHDCMCKYRKYIRSAISALEITGDQQETALWLRTSISTRLGSSGPCWRQALTFDNRGCSSAQLNLLGMTQNTWPPLWFLAIESDFLYAIQNVARNAVIQSQHKGIERVMSKSFTSKLPAPLSAEHLWGQGWITVSCTRQDSSPLCPFSEEIQLCEVAGFLLLIVAPSENGENETCISSLMSVFAGVSF